MENFAAKNIAQITPKYVQEFWHELTQDQRKSVVVKMLQYPNPLQYNVLVQMLIQEPPGSEVAKALISKSIKTLDLLQLLSQEWGDLMVYSIGKVLEKLKDHFNDNKWMVLKIVQWLLDGWAWADAADPELVCAQLEDNFSFWFAICLDSIQAPKAITKSWLRILQVLFTDLPNFASKYVKVICKIFWPFVYATILKSINQEPIDYVKTTGQLYWQLITADELTQVILADIDTVVNLVCVFVVLGCPQDAISALQELNRKNKGIADSLVENLGLLISGTTFVRHQQETEILVIIDSINKGYRTSLNDLKTQVDVAIMLITGHFINELVVQQASWHDATKINMPLLLHTMVKQYLNPENITEIGCWFVGVMSPIINPGDHLQEMITTLAMASTPNYTINLRLIATQSILNLAEMVEFSELEQEVQTIFESLCDILSYNVKCQGTALRYIEAMARVDSEVIDSVPHILLPRILPMLSEPQLLSKVQKVIKALCERTAEAVLIHFVPFTTELIIAYTWTPFEKFLKYPATYLTLWATLETVSVAIESGSLSDSQKVFDFFIPILDLSIAHPDEVLGYYLTQILYSFVAKWARRLVILGYSMQIIEAAYRMLELEENVYQLKLVRYIFANLRPKQEEGLIGIAVDKMLTAKMYRKTFATDLVELFLSLDSRDVDETAFLEILSEKGWGSLVEKLKEIKKSDAVDKVEKLVEQLNFWNCNINFD